MKQWLWQLLVRAWSVAMIAAMLCLASGSALAGTVTQSGSIGGTGLDSGCASADYTATIYMDAIVVTVDYTMTTGSDGCYSGSVTWDGYTATSGSVLSQSDGGGSYRSPANPSGSFTDVVTVTPGAQGHISAGIFAIENAGCYLNPVESGGTDTVNVNAQTSPGSISLGSYSGMPYNQVQLTIESNLYNDNQSASWTVTQQQLNASGGVVATHTYPLSTPPGGAATWTSSNQAPGYAYRYTASVAVDGTTYTTNPVIFPVAGTPTVGSITSTGAVVSWPAVDSASPYTFGWWLTGSGSWPGTSSSVNGTSEPVTGLSPNTEYTAGIAASTPDGGNRWAQGSAAFWTLANPPSGVTLSFSGSTASVSWSANGDPAGTTYQYSVVPAGSNPAGGSQNLTQSTSATVAGVCGGSYVAYVHAMNGAGVWTSWVASGSVAAPACLSLSISAPTGYPPSNAHQLNVTVASLMTSAGTATITQQQLSPAGAVVATHTFSVSVGAGSGGTYTVTNQQVGGAGYVYRYTATMSGQTSNSALFANAPTFYVHRRTRGLFVTFPDEGNGARYEVFGGPDGTGCGSGSGSFNSGVLPAGTTQWVVGGLSPNTEYGVCMWAEIPGQPVTPGGWLPTWWSSGGNPNASGMWYTLPDAPGRRTKGGLLAAYYDVPSLASHAGPSEQVFGHNADYTAVQGPIDFSISCNCTSSWPYVNNGGPMPANTAGSGTATDFAAKYLGWVYAPSAGSYTFGCHADDACQVWVNGQPVVDGMTSSGSSPNYFAACNACSGPTGTITLATGTWYPLEIDYTQGGGGAAVDFTWTPPGGAQAPVPASDLAYPELQMATPSGTPNWNVQISWGTDSNPVGSTHYDVWRTNIPPGASASRSSVCTTTADSCTTSGLTTGVVYNFYADAVSGDGYKTPQVGPVWLATAATPTVSAASPSSISVSWPALNNGTNYVVFWNTQNTGTGASNSGNLTSGQTSYTITGLSPNATYYVWLQAAIPNPSGVNFIAYWVAAGTSPEWTQADPPSSLVLTGASNSLSMSWSPNGNPSGTEYKWSVTAQGGSAAAQSGSATTDGATASGLVCQSNYTAAVEAVNGAGVATVQVTASGETGTCSPPPKVALEIDNGLAQTASKAVTLDIQATDANYTQSRLQMRFSNDGNSWSAWQTYAATARWTLTGAPGPNTVYAEVRDPQDGLGSAIATISYDSSLSSVTSRSGTACTYDGTSATCTKSPIVTATFTVPSGSVSMETSLDGTTWSQPQDAKASVSLVLPTGDGLKAVFARYFNQDNVATPEGPDYFVLDTTAPVIQSVAWLNGAAVTQSGSATLVVQASDNITPASALQVTVSGAASWSGTLPSNGQIPLTVTGSGYVTVDVKVADQAGNTARRQTGIYN